MIEPTDQPRDEVSAAEESAASVALPVPSATGPTPLRPDDREIRMVGTGYPTETEDGVSIWFPDIETIFELESIKVGGKSDDPSAMVSVWRKEPNQERRFVHRSRLLLYGTRARTDFVGLLNKRTSRWSFRTDWLFALEQVVALVTTYLDTGTPLIDLWEVEPPPALPYLFEPLVPDGELTILFGDGGTLKSYLALLLCLGAASGVALPYFGATSRVGATLYLDYETTEATHARRLRAISAGLGLGPLPGRLFYRRMTRPIHQDAGQIRKLVLEKNIVLVIIDSVGMACGGDINESGDTLRTITALTSLGPCAKLGIGHKNKMQDFIGSVYWRNGPRAMWEVNAEQGRNNTKRVGYIHQKANDDRIRDPFALSVEFEPGGRILFDPISSSSVTAVRSRLPGVERVYLALQAAGAGTQVSLLEAVNADGGATMSAASLRTYLSTLERDGRIERRAPQPGPSQAQLYSALSEQPLVRTTEAEQRALELVQSAESDDDEQPDELPF